MLREEQFGSHNGRPITIYTLSNSNGVQAAVMNWGATLVKLMVPDRNGKLENVTLGYDSFEGYLSKTNPYYGATIGRYANRIRHGRFELQGKTYHLATNHGIHHLHGGMNGFDKRIWDIEKNENANSLTCGYTSVENEEAYPGKLDVTVTYTLREDNAIEINYKAQTDKATLVNLTNHAYFNLSGNKNQPITNHYLQLFSEEFTETDELLIPTGQILPVAETPLDFRVAKLIGRDMPTKGYDDNVILTKSSSDRLRPAAVLIHKDSGRRMEMFTTEPGVQFYSGNREEGNGQWFGLCLEAQHYPNSPNEPSFPTTILNPGELYSQKTVYAFSVEK